MIWFPISLIELMRFAIDKRYEKNNYIFYIHCINI